MSKECEGDSPIVCLMIHGLLGSASLFRQKTGAIRKLCKSVVYEYVNGPICLDLTTENDGRIEKGDAVHQPVYGWFNHTSLSLPSSKQPFVCNSTTCWTCRPTILQNFDLGLNYFRKMICEIHPACVLCFSQGATVALAAILLDLLDVYEEKHSQFKHLAGLYSVMLASPWIPHPCQSRSYSDEPSQCNAVIDIFKRVARAREIFALSHETVQLPFRVLVIYGSADSITPPTGIEYLRSICPYFRYVEHPNGHLIPTTEPVRTALREELNSVACRIRESGKQSIY